MSTADGAIGRSLQEALARQLVAERVAPRHHAPRRARRHTRAALVLRRLAERLDPATQHGDVIGHESAAHPSPYASAGTPNARAPRPWSAQPRRAPHRNS